MKRKHHTAEELDGADFVAVVRLSDKANNTLAKPQGTCERVFSGSLPGLLASGKIVPRAVKTMEDSANV